MRKVLLVIDMQKDFIDGSLGTPEAVAIVDKVVAKMGEYDPSDIIMTRDTHQEDYMDSQEGKHLPVIHCVEGTEGWEIRPEVAAAAPGAKIIDKPNFGSPELAKTVAGMYEAAGGDMQVEMVGLCTDICVMSNALLLKACVPEMPVFVDPACCAGVTPEKHDAALEVLNSCQVDLV